jgi:uncharacterized SAM-binding protein YcdF (DUF218 family)
MSKILTLFILPPAFIALLWAAGLIASARTRKRLSLALLVSSFMTYYLLSTWPLAGVLIGSLESGFPPRPPPTGPGDFEAVVVLSGGISTAGGSPDGVELSGSTWRRLWRGAEDFHRSGGNVPLIFSGHEDLPPSAGGPRDPPWTSAARRLGIPEAMLWEEGRSTNTFESAVEVKKLLDERLPGRPRHSILLVTSAWHLRRSVRAFECQGLAVVPDPADSRAGPEAPGLASWVPSYEALASSSVAIREWIGILAYRLLKGC